MTDKTQDNLAKIIEREFRNALPLSDQDKVTVNFDTDCEAIEVTVNQDVYRFEAGSDDDEFIFECISNADVAPVTFEIPADLYVED